MSKKIEMIKSLLENGHERDVYDLLMGVSTFSRRDRQEAKAEQPTIELTKLVGAVREHLLFISKYGTGKSHVIEDGSHHFSYPDKLSEWLSLDAPGIYEDDLESLYNSGTR
ncbi:hypothetical protein [Dyella ginsengisoli]|uniref:hypothetical protein n=1 Tax=Dyella ginsengisoli TaxID=363848 RepID=UPI0012FD1334|nr:hypothetical protein [Dyella ginsengisoli]